jgi:hypothetical protein
MCMIAYGEQLRMVFGWTRSGRRGEQTVSDLLSGVKDTVEILAREGVAHRSKYSVSGYDFVTRSLACQSP